MSINAKHSSLFLNFASNAPLEDVLAAVELVYKRTGCAPCGRLSILLKAEEIVDPAVPELRQIGSLQSILELGEQTSVNTASARR